MTRTNARILSILSAATIACVTSQGLSYARSIPASAGRARFAADADCFSLSYQTMTNVCSTSKRLEIPLVVDAAGTYTVSVVAQGATSSNNVGCEAVGSNAAATSYSISGVHWLPVFGSAQTITASAYVPSGGRLYATCDVSPNGRVNTLVW
jgi:hypothetical protein